MKIVYELTEKDIKDIIAEHFKLPANTIHLEAKTIEKRHGDKCYETNTIMARIEKDAKTN